MAKVLKSFEFVRRGEKYPWSQWLDGRIWELTQGTDFKCSIESMRSNVAPVAKKRGGKVRTSVVGNTLMIQFIGKATQ